MELPPGAGEKVPGAQEKHWERKSVEELETVRESELRSEVVWVPLKPALHGEHWEASSESEEEEEVSSNLRLLEEEESSSNLEEEGESSSNLEEED